MKNRMSDLRNHLFETIESLKDETKPMDISLAKAISDVAQTIINSAKVEIEFAEAIGLSVTSHPFFDATLIEGGKPREPYVLPGERKVG
jgi:hypothetical protein